jgi:o-succinylbenzoate synthase
MWTERRGLHLRLMDGQGHVGHGEASPLPGYSPDDVDRARAALGKRPWEVLSELDENAPISVQLDHILAEIDTRLPSARFAVETAILDLIAQRRERPLWTLLSDADSARPVALAATLAAADARDVLPAARAAHARGIDTLKLKVGRPGSFSEELDLIRVLKRELDVTIRVDANRSFPTRKLPKMLEQLAKAGVSLCEEPSTFDAVVRLSESPVPLAFDESLIGPEGDTRLSSLGDEGLLGAVVLKPTTLGGLFRCKELARRARAAKAPAIVSHTLDGPIAFMASAALVVALPEPRLPAGMDEHPGLGVWPEVDLPALGKRSIEPVSGVGLGLPRIVDWT